MIIKLWKYFTLLSLVSLTMGEDYYSLLGVRRDANKKEIRQTYKKLAVTLHPDKNQDDPDAHEKFLSITKAYETLKDDELRKKYDLYGEEGAPKHQSYHSWNFYQDNFGIYDDDPEVITLDTLDFEQSVLSTDTLWFINFYSPMCSHCHEMAPEWRKMARELEGVVKIGAVNCVDEWNLCNMEHIASYPTLKIYPSGERYIGIQKAKQMVNYLMDKLEVEVTTICADDWDSLKHKPSTKHKAWLLFLCDSWEACQHDDHIKVAAILEGLVSVGVVDCIKQMALCNRFGSQHGTLYWEPIEQNPHGVTQIITSNGPKDISKEVLDLLPDVNNLEEEEFEDMRTQLLLGSTTPWLILFYVGSTVKEDLELKKLSVLLFNMHVGKVNCAKLLSICLDLNVNRYPLFAVFKQGGGYEIHHGKESAHDVANFAKESGAAINVRILTPKEYYLARNQVKSNDLWIIDFFAPWCPPCLRLLPELRKASRHLGANVNIGTIDCTVHSELCRKLSIQSYPTTILYNHTDEHLFYGDHKANNIVEFVYDILNHTVIRLTEHDFTSMISEKPSNELWLVNYFAPWCYSCKALTPEWRHLAKMARDLPNVYIGEVNCEKESIVCMGQGIRAYPSIRLYPFDSKGVSTFAIYSGYSKTARSLFHWLFNFLPSPVLELNPSTFNEHVMMGEDVWLVDFYAPWCGHCVEFAPVFHVIAQKLQGVVKAGNVDCDKYVDLCHEAGITGYPTVKLFLKPSEFSYGDEIPSQSKDYILTFVKNALETTTKKSVHDEF